MTLTNLEQFTVRRSSAEQSCASVLPPAGHFIGGAFVPGSSNRLIDVVDPTTEQVIASVQAGTASDVDVAVEAAVAAQKSWGATTPKERSEVLSLIASIIEANREAFEIIESANTGKPRTVAEDDVSSTIDTFRFMAGASRTLTSMAGGDYATGHTSVILREPVGVVGVITPWNYPLLMAAWKIAPILAAGIIFTFVRVHIKRLAMAGIGDGHLVYVLGVFPVNAQSGKIACTLRPLCNIDILVCDICFLYCHIVLEPF